MRVLCIPFKSLNRQNRYTLEHTTLFRSSPTSLVPFCIHDDLFDRIKSTHQDQSFLWKFSYNEELKMNLRVKK